MFGTERLLARTFFARLFESELMPPGLPQVQLVIGSLSMMAAPGFIVAFEVQRRYAYLWRTSPERLRDAILADQLLFVTYSMMAVGLVALVIWEGVFPDRRDVRTLGVLPLRTRTHVIARLAALAAVAALFSAGANIMSAVVYGNVLWSYGAAAGPVRAIAAHLIGTGLAGLCVFFTLVTAQGVLLNAFGRRQAQQLALALQLLFVVVLLQALMFVPSLAVVMRAGFRGEPDTFAAFLPPTWFVALYNVIAGTPGGAPGRHALGALAATLGSMLMAATLLALSYPRLVRMALEAPDRRSPPRTGTRLVWADRFWRANLRPVRSAVARFTLRTVMRSRTHLILLAIYTGIGFALVVATLVPFLVARGASAIWTPHTALLSAPLIVNFWMLCGLRVLFGIPSEIRANWALRLYAPDDQIAEAVRGVRMAMLLLVVVPVALAAGAAGLALWGLRVGAVHAVFTGAAGVLLVDLLVIRLRKIPFTCTYHPGRSRARFLWPLYVAAFAAYAFGLAGLEAIAIDRWVALLAALFAIAALDSGLAILRKRDLQAPPGLTYAEEDPEALFAGFRLSEGIAAETMPSARAAAPR